eukprot:GHUV01025056.1.p1 GENE.GHUV01025056.1~~GHUV01025056.1.p1  ORF type:complete len:170 (+),score=14.08 GHUV01025056.1:225-734(+)
MPVCMSLPQKQSPCTAVGVVAAVAYSESIGRTSLTGGLLLPGGGGVVCVDEDLVAEPAVNLSNKLNPNNIHYDRELAARWECPECGGGATSHLHKTIACWSGYLTVLPVCMWVWTCISTEPTSHVHTPADSDAIIELHIIAACSLLQSVRSVGIEYPLHWPLTFIWTRR